MHIHRIHIEYIVYTLTFIFIDDDEKGPDCWICYDPDRNDCGPMIHPCDCRGDVGAVHHDCLRRWLVEVNIDWVKSGKNRLTHDS